MKKSKQKPSQELGQVLLKDLITHLSEGKYVIPGFQREFTWRAAAINDLMRSIFRDYYIGNLLLCQENEKNNNFDALNCKKIYGAAKLTRPAFMVLDGQQRLSAMYYSFFAPDMPPPRLKKRTLFFIRVDYFMEGDYEEAFRHGSTSSILKIFEDRERQFEKHMFPLELIGQGASEITIWTRDYEKHWKRKEQEAIDAEEAIVSQEASQNAQNVRKFEERLLSIIDNYPIAYIALNPDTELDKVCKTFTKINTTGVKLDIFDLMNAYLSPKDLELKEMWREAKDKDDLKFMETEKTKIFVLQAMSVSQQGCFSQKDLYNLIPGHKRNIPQKDGSSKKVILVNNKEEFKQLWGKAIEELCNAIQLLRDRSKYGVVLSKYIPYTSILPVFAVVNAEVKKLPAELQFSAKRKIERWYWLGAFTRRYQSQADSINARDYQDLKKWFDKDAVDPPWMAEFESLFKRTEMKEAMPHGSVYNGIFNILISKGAHDWATGEAPPPNGELDNHHIVPQSWGKENSPDTSINTILNRTPLSPETNRKFISDHLPNKYLPKLINGNDEQTVRGILESHLISSVAFEILMKKPFTRDDYEKFIRERERTLRKEIIERVLG